MGRVITVFDPGPGDCISDVIDQVIKLRLDGFIFNGIFIRLEGENGNKLKEEMYEEYYNGKPPKVVERRLGENR